MANNLSGFLGACDAIPKRVLPLFFLIDASGSMDGKKIGQVNSAIEELIPELREISESQADSEIRMSVMTFSSGCEWITPSLMSLESFDDWEPIKAEGLTDLGAAFLELNDKLSKNGFMSRTSASSGFYQPIFFLLSDGEPTDDWRSALKLLQQNKWFKSSIKIAIAIGDDANCEVLEKVIRNKELLFRISNTGDLKKMIRFTALTSSQIASTSAVVSSDTVDQPADISDVSPVETEKKIAEGIKYAMNESSAAANSTLLDELAPTSANDVDTPQGVVIADDDDDWD